MNKSSRNLISASLFLGLVSALSAEETKRERPFGLEKRVPLTTSNIVGTPDPPPPFRTERVFPKINFDQPTVITSAPNTSRLFVAENKGPIYSFENHADCETKELFADLKKHVETIDAGKNELGFVAVYGLTFHPNFAENRLCYICYVINYKDGKKGQHPDGTRVSSFRVNTTGAPKCDMASEKVIIAWLQGGHNGGCLKFGPDGYLYISTGDGGFAFPPDGRNSGQDVSTLLSTVMRIDVDHSSGDRPYSIPDDNPLLKYEGARGEIFAYGLRNPWKMSFDRKTGELWVGDVGWELWELVYRVRPGDNFGWSLVEGRQPVHTERERGPTPIVPPTVEVPHTDGASITGGFVYRGRKFPELQGSYIFGDWETRRIWGVEVKKDSVGPRRELVDPTVRIVAFAEDADGELYLMDYDDGTIHQFVRNEVTTSNKRFPRRLSETGLFQSMKKHQPAPGVVPFSINAEQWADHATAERFLAIPGTEPIRLHEKAERVPGSMFNRLMDFPVNSVLAKTLSLETEAGNPKSKRRIETQILHFDGKFWRGYTYEWNAEQTDAVLVESQGKKATFEVADDQAPGGRRKQTWQFSSRNQCMRCHNPWAEHTLAFNMEQINKDHEFGPTIDNQIRSYRHVGLIEDVVQQPEPDDPFAKPALPKPPSELPRLTNPYDESAGIGKRARSYLQANCAHCHRFNGGGVAYIYLTHDLSISKMGALEVRPTQGTFGIHDAKILASGDPYRSTLYLRVAKLGAGRMPHIGSEIVDQRGVELIHDWIRQLPYRPDEADLIDKLAALDEHAILKREKENRARTLWQFAKQNGLANERETPNDEDRRRAETRADRESADRAASRDNQRKQLVDDLLSTTSRSLRLARAIELSQLPDAIRDQIVSAATVHPERQIRDVFESYLPEDQRTKRLGEVIRASEILSLLGDAKKGEQLFRETAGVQCKNCHRLGKTGTPLGPDLTGIGKRLKRDQILESILEPSKNIEPKFATWLIETNDGRVLTGLLVEKTAKEVVIKNAKNETIRVAADDVEEMFPQRQSMMPDLQLRDMTAQQVADLISYLHSLK